MALIAAQIIHFCSYKSCCISRSSADGDTLSFFDGFCSVLLIRHDLERIIGKKIRLLISTYSNQGKILSADLWYVLKLVHLERIIIRVIKSKDNITDSPTEKRSNNAMKRHLETNKVSHSVEQWVMSPTRN